ncbi:GNAT family N-acetyltransferase [Rhizobiaceae bacterium BDR2-2]|uniref:GNAT family N-acetyltransferase n=1 Tax=Ectorhizobium quercum TaxID=2965071 RepID=A0AAE3SVK9_9HYPH|nr:GNAT family N-acetyltransferase [Ectorhizobium quercum]MCX8996490.1 GNAT family N-acetyltransferase [Ectorhizobium quercum]
MPDIVKAAASDRTAVEALVEASYSHYIARIGARPGPMLDDYASSIARGHVNLLRGDGGIEGVLVLIPEEDCLLLDNIAVSPAAQGKGYGRLLMDHAEAEARRLGFRRIRLYTHELMTENQAIYARRGYVETHRQEQKGLKRVFMEKALD